MSGGAHCIVVTVIRQAGVQHPFFPSPSLFLPLVLVFSHSHRCRGKRKSNAPLRSDGSKDSEQQP